MISSTPPESAGIKTEILGLRRNELSALFDGLIDRPYRAQQVFDALHRRGVTEFAAMTDLSAQLRAQLDTLFAATLPTLTERRGSDDGTTKYLLRLADGASIETVDIPTSNRRTLCLSSQAGCGMACTFCVTGHWGAGRNLTAAEIVGQVLLVRQLAHLPDALNLVFMGMGEPMTNLPAVGAALEILYETISPRRITVSTAGVVPGIDEMGRWPRRPNLAVSLHAPDDERRSQIMPINRVWPIAELLAALHRYPLEARRRITIEYLLLADFNDRPADANALARRLRDLPVKINLIPLNPDPVLPSWMRRPTEPAVEAFRAALERQHLTATVRRQRGEDVAAACGQLRAFARPARLPRIRVLPEKHESV